MYSLSNVSDASDNILWHKCNAATAWEQSCRVVTRWFYMPEKVTHTRVLSLNSSGNNSVQNYSQPPQHPIITQKSSLKEPKAHHCLSLWIFLTFYYFNRHGGWLTCMSEQVGIQQKQWIFFSLGLWRHDYYNCCMI